MNEHQRIFKGAGIMTLAGLLSRVFEIGRIIFITNFFSVSAFGIFSIATDTAFFIAALIMPNIAGTILRFFPEYHHESESAVRNFFSSVIIITILKSALLVAMFSLFAGWIAVDYYEKAELILPIKLTALIIILQPLADILIQFLLSLEKFTAVMISRVSFSAINVLALIFFYLKGAGDLSLLYSFLLAYVVQVLIAFVPLRRFFIFTMPRFSKNVLKFWSPLIAAALFKNITANLPTIIIGRLLDSYSVGLFKVAEKSVKLGFDFIEPYLSSISIVAMNTWQNSREKFIQLINIHNKYSIFLITVIGAIGIIGARFFFNLLYGQDYNDAIAIFSVLILFGVYGSANLTFPRTVFFASGKTFYYLYSIIIHTVIQTLLIIVLTVKFGIWGLVASLVIGRAFVLVLNSFLCKKIDKMFSLKAIFFSTATFTILFFAGLGYLTYKNIESQFLPGMILFLLYCFFMSASGFIKYHSLVKEGFKMIKKNRKSINQHYEKQI